MASDTPPIAEQGVATLPDEAWAQARHRTEIIGPLAALEVVGHEAADTAAQALGLFRRQVYVLIRRARQGAGLLTDLAPGQSGGGKGKGRLPESVERIIRDLLQKRFLTKQKRRLAAFHREVSQACKAQKLRVPARNTVALNRPGFTGDLLFRIMQLWHARFVVDNNSFLLQRGECFLWAQTAFDD